MQGNHSQSEVRQDCPADIALGVCNEAFASPDCNQAQNARQDFSNSGSFPQAGAPSSPHSSSNTGDPLNVEAIPSKEAASEP